MRGNRDRALLYLQEVGSPGWRKILATAIITLVWLTACYAIGMLFWAAYS